MEFKGKKIISIVGVVAILVAVVAPIIFIRNAQASALNIAMIRLDRMQVSTATTGTVCARPTSTATEEKVAITFPAGYTVGALGTWTIDNTYTAGWPGTPTPTAWTVSSPAVATQTVTFTSPDLTVGTTYCFNWNLTTALTTQGSAASASATIQTQTSGGTAIDTSYVTLTTVTSGNDQVTVNGTINPTFTYSLSATSTSFSAITNSVSDASPTPVITITTNARNGWVGWVKDANNGTLNSIGTSSNIPTPGAVGSNYDLSSMTSTGAYGLGVTTSGGTSAPTTEYDGTTAGHAGTLSSSFRMMARSTGAASANTVTLIPRAIASTTQAPASDYTDTLTLVAAGQY